MMNMVKALMPALLIAALPVQGHAGHGTIRETDTQIIIEYTGDAADKPADGKGGEKPGPRPQAPTAPAGQAAVDNGAAAARQQEEARGATRSRERAASPPRGSRGAADNAE